MKIPLGNIIRASKSTVLLVRQEYSTTASPNWRLNVKTVSEWLAENRCTDPEGDWLELNYEQAAELIAKIQLDVRIATLQEAARLVCESCADGYGSVRDHREKGSCVWHGSGKCGASLLHDRVAELEAERGKDGDE